MLYFFFDVFVVFNVFVVFVVVNTFVVADNFSSKIFVQSITASCLPNVY
jgi:hypothetical protein